MTTKCFYRTNIQCQDLIDKNFKFPLVENFFVSVLHIDKVINPGWLNYSKSLNLNFFTGMLFYRTPNFYRETAHIDLHPRLHTPVPGAFNFIIGGKDSDMVWYELPNKKLEIMYTDAGSPFVEWPIKDLKEIDRYSIKENEIVLVRTDVPHQIEMKEQPRWCVSMRFQHMENYSWESLVKILYDNHLMAN